MIGRLAHSAAGFLYLDLTTRWLNITRESPGARRSTFHRRYIDAYTEARRRARRRPSLALENLQTLALACQTGRL